MTSASSVLVLMNRLLVQLLGSNPFEPAPFEDGHAHRPESIPPSSKASETDRHSCDPKAGPFAHFRTKDVSAQLEADEMSRSSWIEAARALGALALLVALLPVRVTAQERPRPAAEFSAGWVG